MDGFLHQAVLEESDFRYVLICMTICMYILEWVRIRYNMMICMYIWRLVWTCFVVWLCMMLDWMWTTLIYVVYIGFFVFVEVYMHDLSIILCLDIYMSTIVRYMLEMEQF